MKQILILILFFSGIFAQAQYQVKTKIIMENEQGQKFDKLICGVHDYASDSVDIALGENYDLPPPPPQSQMYGYFVINNPRTNEKTSSYLDLRSTQNTPQYYVKFNFRCQRGLGSKLYLSWAALTPDKVDSAFITDVVTENIIRVDMIKKDSCIIDNTLLNQFYMQVWYKGVVNSISEDKEDNSIIINNNLIRFNSISDIYEFKLVNLNGQIIMNKAEESIDFSSVENGLYFIVITKNDGSILRKKVLKF